MLYYDVNQLLIYVFSKGSRSVARKTPPHYLYHIANLAITGSDRPSYGSGFGGNRDFSAYSRADMSGTHRRNINIRNQPLTNTDRPPRDQLPLPTRPPYTAHLGNLSFDVTMADIEDFFAGCETTSVRIVEDKIERKPKGFGYVEFGSLDGLKKALDLNGAQFQGRSVRISVAEPRRSPTEDPFLA